MRETSKSHTKFSLFFVWTVVWVPLQVFSLITYFNKFNYNIFLRNFLIFFLVFTDFKKQYLFFQTKEGTQKIHLLQSLNNIYINKINIKRVGQKTKTLKENKMEKIDQKIKTVKKQERQNSNLIPQTVKTPITLVVDCGNFCKQSLIIICTKINK